MSFEERFKLTSNPFRMTPAVNPNEIVWAGFPNIKNRIKNRIKRSLKLPNSSLVLNWGEYGSGKTHAARFFNKKDVLEKLSSNAGVKPPFSMVLSIPKGKEPVYDLYVSIIDKLNIEELREKVQKTNFDVSTVLDNTTDNTQVKNFVSLMLSPDFENLNLIRKFLYGSLTKTELNQFNNHGVYRLFRGDSDFTSFLSCLFLCLTYNKEAYSSIIIWLDEFEDLAVLNSSNIDKTNNFLRELLDNTPNNLLMFINLTQSALFGLEDLGEYVSEAVRSRIKEQNDFELPSEEQIFQYISDLIQFFRPEGSNIENNYFPFEENLIKRVYDELGGSSLRMYNEAFSVMLELADLEQLEKLPISEDFFDDNKDDIIGWRINE